MVKWNADTLNYYLIVNIFITADGDLSGDKHQLKIGNSPVKEQNILARTVIKSIYFKHYVSQWHRMAQKISHVSLQYPKPKVCLFISLQYTVV